MINFDSRTKFFMKSTPTDMRKGYEGLASIVRDVMGHNPRNYNEAFVFYSKDYRKVKILHYDVNGWVLCSKWFTDGKFLKPEFEECKITHELSRETLILIMSTSVQTKMRADNAEQMLGEARKALEENNKRISVLSKQVKTVDDLKDVADFAILKMVRMLR